MQADLLIRVMRFRGRAPDAPECAVFSTDGGTLGAGAACSLRLKGLNHDVEEVIARIVWVDAKFMLIGADRPLLFNGQDVGAGHPLVLRQGDELQLDDYVLGVELVSARTQPSGAAPRLASVDRLERGLPAGNGAAA